MLEKGMNLSGTSENGIFSKYRMTRTNRLSLLQYFIKTEKGRIVFLFWETAEFLKINFHSQNRSNSQYGKFPQLGHH